MASPKDVAFPIYNASTRAPATGQTPTFTVYKNSSGTDVTAPSITEIGGGFYKFTPVFADPTKYLVAIIDCGSANDPRYLSLQIRPEDYHVDLIPDIRDEALGEWRIFKTGPNQNQMILYRVDGTELARFDLKDSDGTATTAKVFWRDPA